MTDLLTRSEYLHQYGPALSDEERWDLHRRYYAQFVDDRTIHHVLLTVGADDIRRSMDGHLNDIPLRRWDSAVVFTSIKFTDVGDTCTPAGLVCVAKEAARQYQESDACGTHLVYRLNDDDVPVLQYRATSADDAFVWMQKNTSYSHHEAITHQGWSVVPR